MRLCPGQHDPFRCHLYDYMPEEAQRCNESVTSVWDAWISAFSGLLQYSVCSDPGSFPALFHVLRSSWQQPQTSPLALDERAQPSCIRYCISALSIWRCRRWSLHTHNGSCSQSLGSCVRVEVKGLEWCVHRRRRSNPSFANDDGLCIIYLLATALSL